MNSITRYAASFFAALFSTALLILSTGLAQVPVSPVSPPVPPASATPAVAPVPAAPTPPSVGIRNKVSAGDLLSAESILEVWKTKNGEDGPWLAGLSWLSRGALLLGETEKAEKYAGQTWSKCAERIAKGDTLEKNHDLETAYGAAIEVKAQLLQRAKGNAEATKYLRGEIPKLKAPVPLIARLNKRLNMITLKGKSAPELVVEDFVGTQPPTLESLRGKPLLIFIWYEGCGDCKAQEAALAHVKSKYELRGLQLVTLTRYYEDGPDRSREKFMIDSVWKSVYADCGTVPMVISTASVEQYGGSSTPTFIFVDRKGIIRRYTPTRLTEEELSSSIEDLLR